MKKILTWSSYFLVCGVVIATAVVAGSKHGHCHECEVAFGKKEAVQEVAYWEKVISQGEGK